MSNDLDEKYLVREMFDDFGWELTPEFTEKYLTDPWIYNLTNALIKLYSEVKKNNES